ncbi:MAG TPA: DUF1801 domain-containing protein [Candidatus Limnocylindria bacterium]|nr:DUF1801 domain-containing protein [Candidatus Limnocylindria bacterium]
MLRPVSVSEQLKRIPRGVRPTVREARRTVKAAAPAAKEIAYQSRPPRSKSALWKLVRYTLADGIGTFPSYATLFFYRGSKLDDAGGSLEGGGKAMRFIRLHTPADATRPAVKRLVRRAFALAKG